MGAKKIELFSVADWVALKDSERIELIEGEFVKRSMPSADHSFSASKVCSSLSPFNLKKGSTDGPGGWWIFIEASVVYPKRPNGFVHDLAGWKRSHFESRPAGKKIIEKPDWVCEILSETRSADLIRKKRVLYENRVANYWTLDLRDQVLTVMRWVEGGYLNVQEIHCEEVKDKKVVLEPFFEMELSVEVLFGIEN